MVSGTVVEVEQLRVEVAVERDRMVAEEYHAGALALGANRDGVDGRGLDLHQVDVAALGDGAIEIVLELGAAGGPGGGHPGIHKAVGGGPRGETGPPGSGPGRPPRPRPEPAAAGR